MPLLTPPPLSNDCFALPRGVSWTPVETALANLRERLREVVGTETVPLEKADGRVLARDHAAARSNPPGANSAVDGYGFAFADLPKGEGAMPLVEGRAAAGSSYDKSVPPGHAIRILTGALLPQGVDTVVLEEDTTTDGVSVAFHAPKEKANTRPAGEDIVKGSTALRAGARLGPPELALAAAVGLSHVEVFEPLKVAVLSTGDELAQPSGTAPPSTTFDANRPMLLSLIRRWGFEPIDLGAARDDRARLRAQFDRAAEAAHALLTSGGASAGDEDHVSALLSDAGALDEWRIALKPGRPLALGLWRGMPVFGLPGNPVAAFVCSLIFARPALHRLAGAEWTSPEAFTVPAAFAKSKRPGRREYLRARLTPKGGAEVFASEGSGRITGLAWSTGLVELGDGAQEISLGDPVRYLPYASFGIGG